MKIVWLATSGRDLLKAWEQTTHYGLGTTVVAMMEGFRAFPEHEIHVLMAVRRDCQPMRREGNIFYHEVPTPMWGMMKSLYLFSTRALLKKIREIQPDVVHGQGTERECALPAIFSGLPNVLTIHGNMRELARLTAAPFFSFNWLAARLEGFVLPRTDGVFCNSAYTHSLVAPNAKKTWMIPNPLMSEFFVPRTGTAEYPQLTLLNVGVISPRKRQLELVDLAFRLHRRHPEIRWTFIGPIGTDDYSRRFIEKVESREAQTFIRFAGRTEFTEIREEMDRSHAMVHFPVEESFGLVVAEALARGLKMFAANVGGISEICAGVFDAELVDPEDWSYLESSVSAWVERGGVRSDAGVETMRRKYHPRVVAQRHLEIYRELLLQNS